MAIDLTDVIVIAFYLSTVHLPDVLRQEVNGIISIACELDLLSCDVEAYGTADTGRVTVFAPDAVVAVFVDLARGRSLEGTKSVVRALRGINKAINGYIMALAVSDVPLPYKHGPYYVNKSITQCDSVHRYYDYVDSFVGDLSVASYKSAFATVRCPGPITGVSVLEAYQKFVSTVATPRYSGTCWTFCMDQSYPYAESSYPRFDAITNYRLNRLAPVKDVGDGVFHVVDIHEPLQALDIKRLGQLSSGDVLGFFSLTNHIDAVARGDTDCEVFVLGGVSLGASRVCTSQVDLEFGYSYTDLDSNRVYTSVAYDQWLVVYLFSDCLIVPGEGTRLGTLGVPKLVFVARGAELSVVRPADQILNGSDVVWSVPAPFVTPAMPEGSVLNRRYFESLCIDSATMPGFSGLYSTYKLPYSDAPLAAVEHVTNVTCRCGTTRVLMDYVFEVGNYTVSLDVSAFELNFKIVSFECTDDNAVVTVGDLVSVKPWHVDVGFSSIVSRILVSVSAATGSGVRCTVEGTLRVVR